ncbi:Beta-lactamase class C. By similarity [Oleispira antarctica RB-8]|uniref:Beta-lactamase class C. By similarity n=1 Tax=Oleispira antarctica RB-8 TaxID=698738 RepID=R4YU79_OLEAN|nr:Beta-lactamase class C. By similarity [Oleispira antarctica RB-8]
MSKTIIKISVVAALVLISVILFSGQALPRLYNTATLFDKDKIVHNFSNMKDVALTIEIKSSSEPYLFSSQPQALPESFQYGGNVVSTEEFLKRSDTTALVVLKNEDITHESYYLGTQEDDKRISWSVAKSFLSALVGIAVERGQIKNINDLVTDYVPLLKNSGYNKVTIKNVLQMSSGIKFDENYNDFFSDINRMGRVLALGGSFDEFAASLENEKKQGKYLHYVSIDTHVLGMVLRGATGESIADNFKKNLWDKIHPESSTYYLTDDLGEPMVLGGLNMRSRDFLKLGKLYRDGGRWNGEQIVPESWVKQSITPDSPHLMPGKRDNSDMDLGYGYQWWLPVDADEEFMALGIYDQFIYINKKTNVVIVKNSANIDFLDNNFESANETVAFFRAVADSLKP